MDIAFSFFGQHHNQLKIFAEQLNVKHAVTTLPNSPQRGGYVMPWDYHCLAELKQGLANFGMKLDVIEGINFIDSAKLGLEDKDIAIERFCELLKNMDALDIRTVCYNWMPIWEWFRTDVNISERGGSLATGFSYSDVAKWPLTRFGSISKEQLWQNLEYFLKKVVPVAESYGIQLAIHPDDPPVDAIAGISRILTSSDAMYKVTQLVPSKYNGITFCQGSFATMGEDIPTAIKRFGNENKIFFSHFRDIRGDKNNFAETYHDNGKTDMYEAMKTYIDVGYKGVMRPDHVPSMCGEESGEPSYGILGNLYAVGYMRGLLESIKKDM